MYAFESSPKRAALHTLVIATASAGMLLFSLSTVDTIPLPLAFQTAAILCLAVAVYLLTRYSLRIYRYAVEESDITAADGSRVYDLVITEYTGKKHKTVARVALRDLGEVVTLRRDSRDARAARKAEKARLCKGKLTLYHANVPALPAECLCTVPDEDTVLIIPWDETMAAILDRAAKTTTTESQL